MALVSVFDPARAHQHERRNVVGRLCAAYRPVEIMHCVIATAVICWLAQGSFRAESVEAFPIFFSLRRVVPVSQSRSYPGPQRPRPARYASRRESDGEHSEEALHSLAEFHIGSWYPTSLHSFTVSDDGAAGILHREHWKQQEGATRPYMTQVYLDPASSRKLTEEITLQDAVKCSRTIDLLESSMDVDTVDGSYSFHSNCRVSPDAAIPSTLLGLEGPDPVFLIEHCLAVSDLQRTRLWVAYGDQDNNGVHQQGELRLLRVAVSYETRETIATRGGEELPASHEKAHNEAQTTVMDLLEMENDIERLVSKISGSIRIEGQPSQRLEPENNQPSLLQQVLSGGTKHDSPPLKLHAASLLEMSSGIWLGDTVIRELPMAPMEQRSVRKSGFAHTAGKDRRTTVGPRFGAWNTGVQKSTWEWQWDLAESIQQTVHLGRSMGPTMETTQTMVGQICVNEGLSRRVPRPNRMVYIQWTGNDNVSFLLESSLIQVRSCR
jgi:hypothetical protein